MNPSRFRQSRTPHTFDSSGNPLSWAGTLVEYDILGRVKRTTVPTEINSSWNPAGDDYRGMNGSEYIWLWNQQEYDWKGRVVKTIPTDSTGTDGKESLISYDGCGCAGGQVTTVQGPLVPRDDIPTQSARRSQRTYADILGRDYKAETYQWDGTTVYSTVVNSFKARDPAVSATQTEASTSISQVTSMI